MLEQLMRYRSELHKIPELGHEEIKTKAYIMSVLEKLNCHVEEIHTTGIVAFFDFKMSDTIAFRTDMDGLPIAEATGLDYASVHTGKMHACGHDGHMAMVLMLANYVNEHAEVLEKNVVLIFQPSEEKEAGARFIVNSGVLEKFGISEIYGIHLWPKLPIHEIYSRPNEFMAMGSEVTVKIIGKSAHVADAKNGIDALYAASSFVTKVYEMEKAMSQDVPHLLKFGSFKSGTARNIISDETILEGTARSFSSETQQFFKNSLRKMADDCEKEYGCKIDISYNDGYDVVINDEKLFNLVQSKIKYVKLLDEPVLQSEDFGLYRKIAPSVFFFLGVGDTETLHNEKFDFDIKVLETGVKLYIDLLKK